ncbi:hypothetical protein ALT721_660005 [Alteromonas alvinellae]
MLEPKLHLYILNIIMLRVSSHNFENIFNRITSFKNAKCAVIPKVLKRKNNEISMDSTYRRWADVGLWC